MSKTARGRINRNAKKAELDLAHDPEAKKQIKTLGLDVGKCIRYFQGGEYWGTVKTIRVKSVVVQKTAAGLLPGGENIVIREDEVPFANIREVLGDSRLADRSQTPVLNPLVQKGLPPAPMREKGYESCDIGRCPNPPTKAYLVRKRDDKTGAVESRLVAVCREHDEKYIEPSDPNKARFSCSFSSNERIAKTGVMQTPAHIPVIWNLGVVFDEYSIPKTPKEEQSPEGAVVQTTADRDNSGGVVFETCFCGKEFGHHGFHRKVEEEDEPS